MLNNFIIGSDTKLRRYYFRVPSLVSMASPVAPTVSSGSTLRLKSKKEKEAKSSAKKSEGRRLTKKNILCSPYHLAW